MTIEVKQNGIYMRRSGRVCRCVEVNPINKTAYFDDGHPLIALIGRVDAECDHSEDIVDEIVVGEAWKPWNGGGSPTTWKVEVIYRTGARSTGYGDDFSWKWRNTCDDIVAYRLWQAPIQDIRATLPTEMEGISPQFFEPKIPAKLRDGLPERLMLERVANGGFIITDDCGIPGRINSVLAALSSEQDLLFWLTGKSPAASAAAVEKGATP